MTTLMNAEYSFAGFLCLGIFAVSYVAVFFEDYIQLRKSKPVLLGAGLIWIIVALIAPAHGIDHAQLHKMIYHSLGEYSSLLLFLLVAMTYISALEDRNVFNVLRSKLVVAGLTYRQLFWVTGAIAFFLSPIADNLTTALVVGAVVVSLGKGNRAFTSISCINIVCAANAGGAFSPFGDITTLMVWQAGKIEFFDFFYLFPSAAVNFLVPALFMSFFLNNERPGSENESAVLKVGARGIMALGILTIALAVGLEQILGLPPFFGMMIGLAFLMVYAWYVDLVDGDNEEFDIFKKIASVEWDTLLFFFGIIFSIGGLGVLGYMQIASVALYQGLGADVANILLGTVSAVIDNIPMMFAVLQMNPDMNQFEWLLITLTAGVGGTLLSIGSAAGVALMGIARGHYTFMTHLKWTPILFAGYAASIATHYAIFQFVSLD